MVFLHCLSGRLQDTVLQVRRSLLDPWDSLAKSFVFPWEGTYHKRRDWKGVSESGFIVWYKNVFYLDKSLNCPHVHEAQSVTIPVHARFWQNAPEFMSSRLTFATWLSYTIPKQSCTYQMFMYIPRCSFRVKLVMRSTCMVSFLILAW